jgi:hypothetical protein
VNVDCVFFVDFAKIFGSIHPPLTRLQYYSTIVTSPLTMWQVEVLHIAASRGWGPEQIPRDSKKGVLLLVRELKFIVRVLDYTSSDKYSRTSKIS